MDWRRTAGSPLAASDGWTAVHAPCRSFSIEHLTMAIPIEPAIRVSFDIGNAILELHAEGSATDLAAKAPKALRHTVDRKSTRNKRLRFVPPDRPDARDERPKVSGQIRAELWTCRVGETRLARDRRFRTCRPAGTLATSGEDRGRSAEARIGPQPSRRSGPRRRNTGRLARQSAESSRGRRRADRLPRGDEGLQSRIHERIIGKAGTPELTVTAREG